MLWNYFCSFFSFCAFGTSRSSCRHAMISLDWKMVTCLSRPCCLTWLIFIESLTLCPSYQIVQKFRGRKECKFQFIFWTFLANFVSIKLLNIYSAVIFYQLSGHRRSVVGIMLYLLFYWLNWSHFLVCRYMSFVCFVYFNLFDDSPVDSFVLKYLILMIMEM